MVQVPPSGSNCLRTIRGSHLSKLGSGGLMVSDFQQCSRDIKRPQLQGVISSHRTLPTLHLPPSSTPRSSGSFSGCFVPTVSYPSRHRPYSPLSRERQHPLRTLLFHFHCWAPEAPLLPVFALPWWTTTKHSFLAAIVVTLHINALLLRLHIFSLPSLVYPFMFQTVGDRL